MTNCNDTIRFPATLAGGTMQHGQSAGDANAARQGIVLSVTRRLFAFLVSAQKNSRDRNSVRKLDDRLLKDVGLKRSDIDHYVSAPLNNDLPPRGF
ncbi:DUF1127 domain-containing protein [Thalassospira marina]|uniref:YjiS-like domain-containing protein n=1 Tax=Thalassospira marina TaxID=2048283 RepID=A0A2N3KEP2_9PROT|nr:DUF1127 domain-containing protein [Thalassospira marina]AUG52689.1 hypothetical protein CSC3H3_08185 [Thalassospira marina]PKR48913.1 hypothetical protein COO20_23405 [Thalassospira marina]